MALDSLNQNNYPQSMSSFSGSDLRAVLAGIQIGEIQQVAWSVVREKGGNFFLGDENPKSFSRGRRYIAGSMMFGFVGQEALIEGMRLEQARATGSNQSAGYYFAWNDASDDGETGGLDLPGVDAADPDNVQGDIEDRLRGARNPRSRHLRVRYADQVMPFNVTLAVANEYGAHARMAILGIEILNMESGFAIETMQADHRYSFLARELTPWVKGGSASGDPLSRIRQVISL
jgi:hypothetical protein